jgi:hypothetical protein
MRLLIGQGDENRVTDDVGTKADEYHGKNGKPDPEQKRESFPKSHQYIFYQNEHNTPK